jgi:hypothetical protein
MVNHRYNVGVVAKAGHERTMCNLFGETAEIGTDTEPGGVTRKPPGSSLDPDRSQFGR